MNTVRLLVCSQLLCLGIFGIIFWGNASNFSTEDNKDAVDRTREDERMYQSLKQSDPVYQYVHREAYLRSPPNYKVYPQDEPYEILLLGDSHMNRHDSIYGKGWGYYFRDLLHPGFVLNNCAVSGSTVFSWLRNRHDSIFEAKKKIAISEDADEKKRKKKCLYQFKKQRHDVVMIGFGTNDRKVGNVIDFVHNLTHLVQNLKAKELEVILLTPPPKLRARLEVDANETYASSSFKIKEVNEEYSDAIWQVGKAEEVLVIDIRQKLTDRFNFLGFQQTREAFFTPEDGTHLSHYGCLESAEFIAGLIREHKLVRLSKALKEEKVIRKMVNDAAPEKLKQAMN